MMDLDSAIQHCEEVAEEQEKLYRLCPASESDMFYCGGTGDCKALKNGKNRGCQKCAEEHHQLAEWLKELKAYKENICGDAVSRQAVLDLVADYDLSMGQVVKGIHALPSVTPQPCGDAISRQAVLNLMRGLTRWCVKSEDGKWKNVGLLYDDVMFGIDRLPSVNPQQRTGRWVKEGQGGRYKWMCSNCGTHHRALYDYCPSCGCKMEVEE